MVICVKRIKMLSFTAQGCFSGKCVSVMAANIKLFPNIFHLRDFYSIFIEWGTLMDFFYIICKNYVFWHSALI